VLVIGLFEENEYYREVGGMMNEYGKQIEFLTIELYKNGRVYSILR
jgi:hypothetical protein